MKIDEEELKILTLFGESDQQMQLPASTWGIATGTRASAAAVDIQHL